MITTIVAWAATILGGGSIWGLLVKAGGWLGWKWIGSATSLPLLGPLSHLAEKLIDLLFWLLRGVLRWLAGGADHISKNVPAAVLLMLITTLAWNFGPGRWRFWESIEPPGIAQSTSQPSAAQRCTDPLSACWWDNLFR